MYIYTYVHIYIYTYMHTQCNLIPIIKAPVGSCNVGFRAWHFVCNFGVRLRSAPRGTVPSPSHAVELGVNEPFVQVACPAKGPYIFGVWGLGLHVLLQYIL